MAHHSPAASRDNAGHTFTLGVVPGSTPGKWVKAWKERMPTVPVVLQPISVAEQRGALERVDAALVRMPIDNHGLHVIPLYHEVPVVIFAADSHLSAADDLTAADLSDQVLITPDDDVLGWTGPAPASFPPPQNTADAIEIAATGVGIVVTPMSLARLHHRRDVDYRPLLDGPSSQVALAWQVDRDTDLVQTFVGIVRGRTARSSRS